MNVYCDKELPRNSNIMHTGAQVPFNRRTRWRAVDNKKIERGPNNTPDAVIPEKYTPRERRSISLVVVVVVVVVVVI